MMKFVLIAIGIVLLGVPIAWWVWGLTIEEPDYSVIVATEAYELRHYAPYVVAETTVSGDFDEAGGRAFRPLASYIFGSNTGAQEMAMTAPVISQSNAAQAGDEGLQMAMTAPVLSARANVGLADDGRGGDQWVYQFVMESKYTMDSLPQPLDPAVVLRPVPARIMAARRFSGRWLADNIKREEEQLLAALRENGIETVGAVMLARYNDPFTPFFLRRNEVLIEVVSPG